MVNGIGIEWRSGDNSKFIFHYNLEYVRSIGEERKITIEKWMPFHLPSKKESDDDECLSLSTIVNGEMAINEYKTVW